MALGTSVDSMQQDREVAEISIVQLLSDDNRSEAIEVWGGCARLNMPPIYIALYLDVCSQSSNECYCSESDEAYLHMHY